MELANSIIVLAVTVSFLIGMYFLKEYDLKRYNLCFAITFGLISLRFALDKNIFLGILSLMLGDLFLNSYMKAKKAP